ncbi:low molecular weight protein-tyrosine-phosphatase [Saccharospirillum alexandrii]|uniref:low molecular weight protein-tyrosine-phosphatase n=1 Tax=Saccharospirillum alexandrii TaxID=2448477 RepID=UPI000FD7B2A4|nr:low molecular weight protein-tyrosine-phosphatase [Saccharospirillum alexandrii]
MTDTQPTSTSVLFVCLGNICRSPTAQAVFEARLADSPLAADVEVDSAGTAAYHLGKAPDPRSQAAARARGYKLDHLRARQVTPEDFHRFDYILAMDSDNLINLNAMAPESHRATVALFLDFAAVTELRDVPDPYFGGDEGFATVLDLCEQASHGLLTHLQTATR